MAVPALPRESKNECIILQEFMIRRRLIVYFKKVVIQEKGVVVVLVLWYTNITCSAWIRNVKVFFARIWITETKQTVWLAIEIFNDIHWPSIHLNKVLTLWIVLIFKKLKCSVPILFCPDDFTWLLKFTEDTKERVKTIASSFYPVSL